MSQDEAGTAFALSVGMTSNKYHTELDIPDIEPGTAPELEYGGTYQYTGKGYLGYCDRCGTKLGAQNPNYTCDTCLSAPKTRR